MERKDIIKEIVDYCNKYFLKTRKLTRGEILDISVLIDDKKFIEGIINKIYCRTVNNPNIDKKRTVKLLLELEKIRLELEYYDKSKSIV
jgi:hypothetical protein